MSLLPSEPTTYLSFLLVFIIILYNHLIHSDNPYLQKARKTFSKQWIIGIFLSLVIKLGISNVFEGSTPMSNKMGLILTLAIIGFAGFAELLYSRWTLNIVRNKKNSLPIHLKTQLLNLTAYLMFYFGIFFIWMLIVNELIGGKSPEVLFFLAFCIAALTPIIAIFIVPHHIIFLNLSEDDKEPLHKKAIKTYLLVKKNIKKYIFLISLFFSFSILIWFASGIVLHSILETKRLDFLPHLMISFFSPYFRITLAYFYEDILHSLDDNSNKQSKVTSPTEIDKDIVSLTFPDL